MQGPLFAGGGFELVPIPDGFGIDERTYGNTVGRSGRPLIEFFPARRHARMRAQAMHVDPEFETFTYGDPTPPKAGLRNLTEGDLLVFYCGLEGWNCAAAPALYICAFFEVTAVVVAAQLGPKPLEQLFGLNFHVRHPSVLEDQRNRLVLVKGSPGSRLLKKAVLISETSQNVLGRPLKVLSQEAQMIFGNFGGHISIERSPTRWVAPAYVDLAAEFVRSRE